MSQLRTSSIQHPSSSSANIVLAADGSVEIGALNGFRFVGTRVFESSGSFVKADPFDDGNPGGLVVRAVRVKCVGGGGGGRGVGPTIAGESAAGTGGSGADYAESFLLADALGVSEDVTPGSGGAGGVGDSSGSDGTNTSFGSLVVASGGRAGTGLAGPTSGSAISSGRAINTGSVGDFVIPGGIGDRARILGGELTPCGIGGASHFSGRTISHGAVAGVVNGPSAFAYGGGGAGAASGTAGNTSGGNGGAGSAGIVIVEVFV